MELRYGDQLSMEEFDQLLDLDRKAFGEDIITDLAYVKARFQKNPECVVALFEEGKAIGFCCFVVVAPQIYDTAYNEHVYFEENLPLESVWTYSKERSNDILCLDNVVAEGYKGRRLGKRLFIEMGNFLQKKQEAGYPLGRIFGYTISPDGIMIVKSFQCTFHWHQEDTQFIEFSLPALLEAGEREVILEPRALTLSEEQIMQATQILVNAFASSDLFKKMFYQDDELRVYLEHLLRYYNKHGEIHVAFHKENMMGVSIWNLPDLRVASVAELFDGDEQFFFSNETLLRLDHEFVTTERHHYRSRHYYLFLLAGACKGTGSALLHFAINRFQNETIYLENSEVEDNQHFYQKFGFQEIKTIKVFGIPIALLQCNQVKEEKQ